MIVASGEDIAERLEAGERVTPHRRGMAAAPLTLLMSMGLLAGCGGGGIEC